MTLPAIVPVLLVNVDEDDVDAALERMSAAGAERISVIPHRAARRATCVAIVPSQAAAHFEHLALVTGFKGEDE